MKRTYVGRVLLSRPAWSAGSTKQDPAYVPPYVLAIVVAMALAVVGVDAATRQVTFRTEDGRTVSGVLFEPDNRPTPAVVLVPMLGRPKDDWQSAGQRLAEAGITALAIDLPGQSVGADATAVTAWRDSIRAATIFLTSRTEAHTAVGVAGASLGANLAALAAAADSRIRSIALVSPTLDYRGVRIEAAMRAYSGPALLVSSVHDAYSARSVRELAMDAPGIREQRWSETTAHGTVLLARDPALVSALVEWFQRTLGSL